MLARAISGALVVVLVCVLLAGSAPALAQDVDTYRETLAQAADELRRSPSSAASVAERLQSIPPVPVAGGAPITPDLSHVIAELRADPPDVEVAIERLDALLATLDRASLDPGDDAAALSALDDVLARDEFAPPEPADTEPSLRERLANWFGDAIAAIIEPIAEWLAPLFGSGDGASSGAVVVRAILAIVGILAVIAVIVLVVRNVRGAMTSDVAHLATERELKLTSLEARADAERLFQSGNYREALRFLYLATLLRLDEAGRLRFDRSLTNQEVLSRTRLHGDQTLLSYLSPLVDRFDRVWYGGTPCSADDYHAFSSLADRIWEAPA